MTTLNPSILAALKLKSDAVQAKGKVLTQAGIQALGRKASAAVPAETVQPEYPLIVTVQRILDKNRLDVFFNRKPSEDILGKLHRHGWRFRPSDKGWFHRDCENNRNDLSIWFDAEFDAVEACIDLEPKDTENLQICAVSNDSEKSEPVTAFEPVNPVNDDRQPLAVDFEKYSKQVDSLCEALKLRPADLMVIAIEELFKQTFN